MSRLLFSVWLLMLCMSAQPQIVIKRCKTCKKPIAQCRYKGRHAPSLPAAIQQLERDMVFVESGTFTMGHIAVDITLDDRSAYKRTAHEVTLSNFRICKHEVTQAEWEAVMGSNPSHFKGANRPVERVSWDDCQTFIRKLNQLTGKKYRLPTEAEWEYAARGGNRSQGYKYSGSNTFDDVAWVYENCGSSRLDDDDWDTNKHSQNGNCTHDVMTKEPNELGLYDMSGNVWEWCSDWCEDYSTLPQINPTGPSTGYSRVYRGGDWFDKGEWSCVLIRGWCEPYHTNWRQGLRLAL